MNRVVVVGSSVVDILVKSKDFKVLKSHEVDGGVAMAQVMGGKTETEEMELCVGGGGSNVAVGLKKLGEAVKLISRVGDDVMGEVIRTDLGTKQVDISMVQKGAGKTGMSVVLISGDGGRTIVTNRGESLKIDGREVDWETLERAEWVQISSLGGRFDLLSDLVMFAFSKGVKVGVNPGRAEIENEGFKKLLPKIDYLSLNRAEASSLTGISFEKEVEVLSSLFSMGVRLVTVTDGKRGASLVRSGQWIKMSTFPDTSVDDTGAGDAFVSGALSGVLNYKSDVEILKRGLANGSSVVTVMGAQGGLLKNEDMLKRLKKKLKMVEGKFDVIK